MLRTKHFFSLVSSVYKVNFPMYSYIVSLSRDPAYTSASEKDFSLLRLVTIEFV